MHQRPFIPPSRRGFNLIEAAIVLGVVGLVIGGIWVAAASVMEKQRQDRFLEQILEITQNIRRGFAGASISGAIAFLDIADPQYMLKDSWGRYIPVDMIGNSDQPLTPWGERISVIVSQVAIGFEIPMSPLITVSTCSALGPRIYAAIKDQLPPGTSVGAAIFTTGGGLDISTPALAASNCQDDWNNNGGIGISFSVNR